MPRMQRLFSMFPRGWPGVALLLLRSALGTTLLTGMTGPLAISDSTWMVPILATVAGALFAGFLTPIASALCVVLELSALHLSNDGPVAIHLCAVLVAAAIAMMGPGGYSVDARLFGRHRIVFSSRDDADDD